jgi:hypothetical protein
MMRGLMVAAGVILFIVGIAGTIVTWTASGWTVLAAAGVIALAVDLVIEERADARAYAARIAAMQAQAREAVTRGRS